jgi:branched-subunit amino acid aminotransferase/4-amino-4-deoxychorismate lyase
MNSQITDEVFMSPVAAHSSAQNSTASQMVFKLAVAASILTAVTAGLYTSSTAVGSTSSADTQYVTQLLNQAGFSAHVTGTNLVVAW